MLKVFSDIIKNLCNLSSIIRFKIGWGSECLCRTTGAVKHKKANL